MDIDFVVVLWQHHNEVFHVLNTLLHGVALRIWSVNKCIFWLLNIALPGSSYLEIPMLKSILVNKYFHTLHLIGWQYRFQCFTEEINPSLGKLSLEFNDSLAV